MSQVHYNLNSAHAPQIENFLRDFSLNSAIAQKVVNQSLVKFSIAKA